MPVTPSTAVAAKTINSRIFKRGPMAGSYNRPRTFSSRLGALAAGVGGVSIKGNLARERDYGQHVRLAAWEENASPRSPPARGETKYGYSLFLSVERSDKDNLSEGGGTRSKRGRAEDDNGFLADTARNGFLPRATVAGDRPIRLHSRPRGSSAPAAPEANACNEGQNKEHLFLQAP